MPPLKPVRWDADQKEAFEAWFHQQLANTQGVRAQLERKWRGALTQWRAARPQHDADFPFPGASNEEFPLTAIHADPIIADFQQSLGAPEDYWTPVEKRPDRVEHSAPLREALTAINSSFLNMRLVNERALLDLVILGTSIYKVHWLHRRKKVKDYKEDGTIGDVVKIVSQPTIEHVPLQHFWIPADSWRIDPDEPYGARWVSQSFELTSGELRQRAKAETPHLPPYDSDLVELIISPDPEDDSTGDSGGSAEENPLDAKIRSLDEYVPWQYRKHTLHEVWVRFDIDGDGIDEDVVVIWHQPTASILRTTFYPFLHGKRPFHATRYLPSFGFYGIGLAEIDEWAQATLTRLMNAQVNNVLLANTRMWAVPQGSGVVPGEPMYPNKILTYQPGERPPTGIQTADIYASLPQAISQFMQFAEMRTAVSELRQGNLTGLPSRTPATTILSILREGNKRFDMILGNFREEHSQIGLRLLQLLVQKSRDDRERWETFFDSALGPEDATLVMEVLDGSVQDVESSFGVAVTATSAQVNKEVEKQALIGLAQITTQIHQQLIQLAQLAEQLPPGSAAQQTAAASYMAGVEQLSRLLEAFDVQNPTQHMGNLQAIAGSLNAQQQGLNPALAQLQQALGGAIPGAQQGAPIIPPGALAGGLGLSEGGF